MLLSDFIEEYVFDDEAMEIWADKTMIGTYSNGGYTGLSVDSDLLGDLEVNAVSSKTVKIGDEWFSVLVIYVDYEEED